MKLKGIIDCDFTNYKEPVLTLEFPVCDFKCDKLNGCQVCQNSALAREPDIEIAREKIWELYQQNPLTKGFCCQGLEPFDTYHQLYRFIKFIRERCHCDDVIIIYTGYEPSEKWGKFVKSMIGKFHNIIIKWGRYVNNGKSYYNKILGVTLASDNQFAEWIK
jgi:hypothetical protein